MLRSNLLFIVFSFLTGLALVGCSMGKPQDREGTSQEAASFFVDKVDVAVTGTNYHPKISLPVSKNYSFRACVKELQYSKAILNHSFEITGGEQTIQASTDNSGCLSWSEKIEYNHLAQAQWVKVTRSVQAKGIQKGQRQLSLALNPWEDQGESLLNKKIETSSDLKALTAANADSSKGLWIDDLRLTIDEKKMSEDGLVLNIEIRTQPSFSVLKTGGRRVLEPITEGQFDAEIILINVLNENGKEVRRPLTEKIKVAGKIANNSLLLETRVTLPESTRTGQVQLGLRVTPVDAPENIGSFEGAFSIAEFDQIKGSFFSRLKNGFQEAQGALKLDQYLTDKQVWGQTKGSNEADIAKDGSSGYQKSQVQIAPLEFDNVGFKSQKGLNREKVFTVTACMMAPVDSKPLRAQVFQIQKANGTSENLRTNDKGCLTWEDSVQFEYLDSECWLAKQIQISSKNYSMNQTLTVQVNPWAEGKSSVRDTRQIGKQELLCANGKSKIVLLHYEFDKKTVKYPIDPHLNIKVQKEGILKLQARLKRPSLVDPTGFEDAALPPGKYLLRWAIVDHSVQDFSKASQLIYQAQEKWVQIDVSGTISETLSFESSNLRALGNTNYLLLELSPEKEAQNLLSATYRGPIVLSNADDGGSLEILQEGQNSLVSKLKTQLQKDQAQQLALQEKLSQKQTFAFNENLALLNLNQEAQTLNLRKALGSPMAWQPNVSARLKNLEPVATQELQAWLYSGKMSTELAKKFCAFWIYDQMKRPLSSRGGKALLTSSTWTTGRILDACYSDVKKDPKRFFEISYRYFLKNPTKTKDLSSELRDLSFNTSFTLSQSHDVTTTNTISADASIGVSTGKWLTPLAIGGGFRYQVSHAVGDRVSSANSAVVQSGESLLLEKLNFQIQASGYEKCAVLRLNPDILDPSRSSLGSSLNKEISSDVISRELSYGLMFCEGAVQVKNVNFTESYFILNQKAAFTQAIDVNSDFGRPLFMAVRGLNDFRRLMQNLGGQMKAPGSAVIQSQVQQSMKSSLSTVFSHGIATYPGQYAADE